MASLGHQLRTSSQMTLHKGPAMGCPSPPVDRSAFRTWGQTGSSELSLSTQLAFGCVLPARAALRAPQCGSV